MEKVESTSDEEDRTTATRLPVEFDRVVQEIRAEAEFITTTRKEIEVFLTTASEIGAALLTDGQPLVEPLRVAKRSRDCRFVDMKLCKTLDSIRMRRVEQTTLTEDLFGNYGISNNPDRPEATPEREFILTLRQADAVYFYLHKSLPDYSTMANYANYFGIRLAESADELKAAMDRRTASVNAVKAQKREKNYLIGMTARELARASAQFVQETEGAVLLLCSEEKGGVVPTPNHLLELREARNALTSKRAEISLDLVKG